MKITSNGYHRQHTTIKETNAAMEKIAFEVLNEVPTEDNVTEFEDTFSDSASAWLCRWNKQYNENPDRCAAKTQQYVDYYLKLFFPVVVEQRRIAVIRATLLQRIRPFPGFTS